jgi:predicted AlkP superfamily phosphohydrolase/phosphomutase
MKPVLILGIDGLPHSLARRLIVDGVMPSLGQLAKKGTLAQMHTTVPDFSCVAWTSFATGTNPGKHGIYGFQDFHPRTGEHYVPTANDCRSPALWHEVGKAGGRSIVFNLPGTYPALPLRGKMVAGFVAPDFDKACYPATFAQTLKSLGYRMDLDGQIGLGRAQRVREVLWPVFEARKVALRHVLKNENWDLCIAVITETDRLQHFFLHALGVPDHPQHDWTRQFYIELDRFIGEVAEMIDGRADLFMVSDHGFEVVRHQVTVEPLLQKLGLAPPSDRQCWVDPDTASRTKVFSLDPGRFYINRIGGRFAHGCVDEREVPSILDTLKQTLATLTDPATGE